MNPKLRETEYEVYYISDSPFIASVYKVSKTRELIY